MKTVLLLLEGPMQAWGGSSSRTENRYTGSVPSMSGVLGIVSAALGRTRDEGPLTGLKFAVRVDRPGSIIRDFQTKEEQPLRLSRVGKEGLLQARRLNMSSGDLGYGKNKVLEKTYLSGARFVAALSGEDERIDEIVSALRAPQFHLYLGRKSCPPGSPVLYGVSDSATPEQALREDWLARGEGSLVLHGTAPAQGRYDYRAADVPVSTEPSWRKFATRRVVVTHEDRPAKETSD